MHFFLKIKTKNKIQYKNKSFINNLIYVLCNSNFDILMLYKNVGHYVVVVFFDKIYHLLGDISRKRFDFQEYFKLFVDPLRSLGEIYLPFNKD